MYNILVVEDSPIVRKIIKHVMIPYSQFTPVFTQSLAQAKKALSEQSEPFFAAILDLTLPDAPDGEIVDVILAAGVPSVVLTGTFDIKKRQALLDKGVVDYVTKEGRFSYEYALNAVARLTKNQHTKVLVVDDSVTSRKVVSNNLKLHLFEVFEAQNAAEAIKVFLANPDIKMIVTDYHMPAMNGCELVKHFRQKYDKSDLILIGISGDNSGALSAQFIKSGANDFLRKPFNHEEFFCRINHNVEFIEMLEELKDSAVRDDQTGAFKLSHFKHKAQNIVEQADTDGRATSIACAAIDIHELTAVFDEHGPEAADFVMAKVSGLLVSSFKKFLFARAGGETFYLMMQGLTNEQACAYIEKVRQMLGAKLFDVGHTDVTLSFSAGVTNASADIQERLDLACEALQRAKDAGGDIVIGDD